MAVIGRHRKLKIGDFYKQESPMKIYGHPDTDDNQTEDFVRNLVADLDVHYFVLHPRKPITARMCQRPQSILVQAVLANGRVITARQDAPGSKPYLITGKDVFTT